VADWGFRYIVRKAPTPTVIGAGGYTGPAKDGAIEIGYSICPSERRRGLATESTQALTDHAFRHSDVARVIAHTLPDLRSSIGVLENCGFKHAGDGGEAGTIRYAIEREDWHG
jgi:[ribosomal protein S5]-alanine N-acetyltransferase